MKLAAIDIGSNAIRLQITKITQYQGTYHFKKLEYLRFPLRLGNDVFQNQEISRINVKKFKQLMQAFKLLIDLYEVDDLMCCATSAMRESRNGRSIVNEVKQQTGLKIQVIDGNREAELINLALEKIIDQRTFLHIDVGGGSTEFNIYKNKEKVASRSFKVGSVRTMENPVPVTVWKSMKSFLSVSLSNEKQVLCIGTGGNINKILELSKPTKNKKYLDLVKIKETQKFIESYSIEERINLLNLNEDRADVIIPATKIYVAAMEATSSTKMIVPNLGLKDGMMHFLFKKNIAHGTYQFPILH